ncbi:hypothetical protein [Paenibacillus sp. NPDC057967]|uniref:hypothetical protein n=1 Tax=Paenibacillus sp. NPDC057967 TaxID=3346293 RepID=UPI0036DF9757
MLNCNSQSGERKRISTVGPIIDQIRLSILNTGRQKSEPTGARHAHLQSVYHGVSYFAFGQSILGVPQYGGGFGLGLMLFALCASTTEQAAELCPVWRKQLDICWLQAVPYYSALSMIGLGAGMCRSCLLSVSRLYTACWIIGRG